MERMWINQPSTGQPFHKWHAMNVLARPDTDSAMQIYFLDGAIISQQVPRNCLSNGWIPKRDSKLDFAMLPKVIDKVKPTLEESLKSAAEESVLKLIQSGSWIAPDYVNRFKVPPEFIKEVWTLVDVENIKMQMAILIERDLAEKIIGLMAAELSSDIKKVLSDTERREAIRAVVRDNLERIVKK